MKMIGSSIAFGVSLIGLAGILAAADHPPLPTVARVELSRYLGKWYEIARFTNSFQKGCTASTATYSLRPDGKITVLNECRKDSPAGKVKVARGKAWVVDQKTNAKLKVQFFWPFSGDYWIIQLGSGYEYAVVGEPGRKYLWILCRRPTLEKDLLQSIFIRLREQGYDPGKLLFTTRPG